LSPSDGLDPEWITTIVALVAFAVSVLSLWFSSLKGPDIDLVKISEKAFEKISKPEFSRRYIPYRIALHPVQLVFINNGTRAGVLRLKATFKSSKELEPFLDEIHYEIKGQTQAYSSRSEQTIVTEPIAIRERETNVVTLSITVTFDDWKEHFNHEPVKKEQIYDVLCQADRQNRERLSTFCSNLKAGLYLGAVSIDSTQTTSRLIRLGESDKHLVKNLQAGLIDNELRHDFKNALEDWDTIEPNRILQNISYVEQFLRKVRESLTYLDLDKPLDQIQHIALNELDYLESKFEAEKNSKAVYDFLLKSAGLDSRLPEFVFLFKRFREMHDRFREAQPIYQEKMKDSLSKYVGDLKKERDSLSIEVEAICEILYRCRMSA